MKSFFRFFLISIIFFAGSKVLAFNSETINLSDDINVLYYDSETIKIKLDDTIKNNNSYIYYQFISSSKNDIDSFENSNDLAYDKLAECLDNSSQDECINNYNIEKDKIFSSVPKFNNNWNKAVSDGTSIYSVPKYSDNYYLWIKAVDSNGVEIYSLFYESSSFNSEVLGGVKTSTEIMSNINDVVAVCSMLFSIGGILSFIFSILYIIKYSHFNFKLIY